MAPMRVWNLPLAACAAALLSACLDFTPQVRARGAYDFRCPPEQVSVTQLSDEQYGADGCGQRATYTLKCPRNAIASESECSLMREPSR